MTAYALPRLVGARTSAHAFATAIPDPADGTITLDATGMEAASQSFADELVVQLLRHRPTTHLTVRGPIEWFARHLTDTARRLRLLDRLTIVPR